MFKKPVKLYCFSPPVMLATFTIEIIFAIYVVWRYHMTTITRLITALLVFLAFFQGTEFLLCGGFGVPGGMWSRLGYASITILPPLGIHLAYALANKKAGTVVAASYISAAAFIGYFVFVTQAISGHTCYANYATFDVTRASSVWYSLYYYGWLFVGTFITWRWAPQLSRSRRAALYALMAGYLALLIPTTTINLLNPETVGGIPSIMCGFAVILATLLALKIAPSVLHVKKNSLGINGLSLHK